MRGVPDAVTWRDEKIMVKMGNMNMPLPKDECKRLFGREPRNAHEAMLWGLRLRRRKVPISFSNIKCGGQADPPTRADELARRKRKRVNQVKVELNEIVMEQDKDGAEFPFPSLEEFAKVVFELDNTASLAGHEPPKPDDDKTKGSLKMNLGGKSTTMETGDKQKKVIDKVVIIKERLHLKSFNTNFAGQ